MKLDINNVYEKYLHMSYKEKVIEGIKGIAMLNNYLVKMDIEERDRVTFYINLTRLFVAADSEASIMECQLFNDIFKSQIQFENFKEMIAHGDDPEFVKSMNKLIDMMDDEAKLGACSYGLVFLSIDRHLSDKEKEVFRYILD